jgi:hypothetical protein
MSDLILKFEMLSESGKMELLQYLENLLKRQSKSKIEVYFDAKISKDIQEGKLQDFAEKAKLDFKKGHFKSL